ncbi:MAG: ABC transporter ATP-binding protein [Chloroflexi bacterium]|nr:ABC transporter ATP-binding protein [Chloroflexota bacterium]
MAAILELQEVSKHFGGLAAVDKVAFDVQQGEIMGVIGPNGAGKTTLLSCISKLYPLTGGQIVFKGQRIDTLKPHQIARLGIGRTFQIVKPFTGMTVKENVAVGALYGRAGHTGSVVEAMGQANEVLERLRLAHKADYPTDEVTIPDRKRLELARALAMAPTLLLLDEVMAGLNPRETDEMMEVIREINRDGTTIMVIEHVMRAIMGICDRIAVMHHGKLIALGKPKEIADDDRVIEAYLGEKFAAAKRNREAAGPVADPGPESQ